MISIELILFTTFIVIACAFIGLGLYRLEHTELSLVGFVFLFLLSMVVIGDNLTYQTGETTNITNTHGVVNSTTVLTFSSEVTTYDYATYQDTSGFFTTHRFGYLLAVMSIIGMIGSFVSIKPERFMK